MMRRFAWILNPWAPTIDQGAGQGDGRGSLQGATTSLSEETVDKESYVRQRLDCLSGFRIHSSAIKFTSGDSRGSGGKADVAQARFRRWYWIGGQLVAVKQLRSIHNKKACNEFVHEVEVMAGLSHDNIVRFIGFVEELENGKAWIVLSWEPNGNVSEFLASGDWEIPERVSLIKDTFEGIKYLHTRQPPICHGDLKSLNILVSSYYRAVITDFGSARAMSTPENEGAEDQSPPQVEGLSASEQACAPIHVGASGKQLTLTGPAWSLRWAAPEVVNGKHPGLSSDIWAAGWVCWEVMTNKVPFPELNAAGVITLTVVQGNVPSPQEEGQLGEIVALCSLMTDCWAFNPRARPNISRCCDEIQWMPSTPPAGTNPSGSKASTPDLLCRIGQMEYEQGNFEDAVLLFRQALSLAMSAGNQRATADAFDWLGDVYRLQSKYTEAGESHTQAQEIYTRIGHNMGRANALRGLGHVYREQSRYTEAEESYTLAQEIYVGIGADLGRANALRGLGAVYSEQAKYTEAGESYTRAQEIYARIGDDLGGANALEGLGEVYRAQSKFSEAEGSFSRAHDIHARIGNDLGRANVLVGLGHVYREQFKYTEAEESYIPAQEIHARIGNDLGRANALLGIGYLRREQGRNAEAASLYMRAAELYAQLGIIGHAELCLRLARVSG